MPRSAAFRSQRSRGRAGVGFNRKRGRVFALGRGGGAVSAPPGGCNRRGGPAAHAAPPRVCGLPCCGYRDELRRLRDAVPHPSLFPDRARRSALDAAVALLPMSLSYMVTSQLSGRIANKLGPRVPMTAGMGLMGLGLLMLALIPFNDSLALIETGLLAMGRWSQCRTDECSCGRQRSGHAIGTASAVLLAAAATATAAAVRSPTVRPILLSRPAGSLALEKIAKDVNKLPIENFDDMSLVYSRGTRQLTQWPPTKADVLGQPFNSNPRIFSYPISSIQCDRAVPAGTHAPHSTLATILRRVLRRSPPALAPRHHRQPSPHRYPCAAQRREICSSAVARRWACRSSARWRARRGDGALG